MIPSFVKTWEENKHKLKSFFKNNRQSEYACSYESIVKALFEIVLEELDFDISKMTVIDDGEYQGTQIFIIPRKVYQPDTTDYLVTDTYYGSCSGCDTLEGIREYSDGLPNEEQVEGYMTLALHLFQKLRWLESVDD